MYMQYYVQCMYINVCYIYIYVFEGLGSNSACVCSHSCFVVRFDLSVTRGLDTWYPYSTASGLGVNPLLKTLSVLWPVLSKPCYHHWFLLLLQVPGTLP